ncbi:hypothetical protein AGMMS50256_34130 [Betaproteobacteria bacterium]|nr:hypothetical protein AGMMS50256_34130 [Betaproteobacteria bacterium]
MSSPDQGRFLAANEARQALLTGGGFALAFGWAWSGALREACFAEILSGSLFSGQGASLFFGTMILVFLVGGFAGARVPSSLSTLSTLSAPLTHGAAVLPLLALLIPGDGKLPAAAIGLGFAGGLAGLYWGARLIRLPAKLAGVSLVMAGGLLTALAGLRQMLPAAAPSMLLAVLPIASLLAWLAARRLAAPPTGVMKLPAKTAVALVLAFVALGALFSAEGYAPPLPWRQCGLEALGTLAFIAVAERVPGRAFLRSALALPFALLPLAALWPAVFALALHLATGALLGLAVMRLARRDPEEPGGAALAGRALLALFLALNAGFFLGARAALPWENAGLALLLLACLAPILLLSLPERVVAEPEQAPAPENDTPEPSTPEFPDLGLTRAEQRVSTFLAQGLSNTAISNALGSAPATVRVHLRSIHKKMKTNNREELVERLQTAFGNRPLPL